MNIPERTSTGTSRRYDNTRRAAAAEETRRRIIDAAGECFAETGFDATAVRTIAERAGTSPETIYATFGNKARLLQTWIDRAVAGDDEDIALRDRDDIIALFAAVDLGAKLRELVRIGRQINERVVVPLEVARAAARSNAELAALLEENERRRHTDFTAAVVNLTADSPLPSGLTIERATELMAALCSVDLYRALVLEAGWTAAEYEAQLVRLVGATLGLDPA